MCVLGKLLYCLLCILNNILGVCVCVVCNIYIIFCVHFWLELFGVEFKLVGDEDRGANAKHIDKHTDTLADRTGGLEKYSIERH